MVGAVALAVDGWGRLARDDSPHGSRHGSDWNASGVDRGTVFLGIAWLLSWLVAPTVVRILALSVSRRREFLADAMAAQFTRQPLALASALRRIDDPPPTAALIGRSVSHLCVVDPLGRGRSAGSRTLAGALASHPPITERIARLEAMGYGKVEAHDTASPSPPQDQPAPAR